MSRTPTIEEKVTTFQFETKHLYYLLLFGLVISFFFFAEERLIVPKWPLIFAFGLMFSVAMGESWEAFKKKGQIVLTTLGIEKGGSSGFNPSGDMRIARSNDPDIPNFAVTALGGFVYMGFSMKGKENFIVCPPEHIMNWYGNIVIKTRLRRIRYSMLPSFIQNELEQLPGFRREFADKRNNLWFGFTSNYYGTDTIDNLKLEEKLLTRLQSDNELKDLLEEQYNYRQRGSRRQPQIIEIPEDQERGYER